ncbi:MAG: hypothetical protein D5R98_02590 [Desulfonatronovibrio sp. MSAO_Bac4]|nr:MAG: hypothetical protein D5R98_02590 [Desulfonatronovibrio sp. MSAO_Bac4]
MEIQAGLGMAGLTQALQNQNMESQQVNQNTNNQNTQPVVPGAQGAQAQTPNSVPAEEGRGQGEFLNKIV